MSKTQDLTPLELLTWPIIFIGLPIYLIWIVIKGILGIFSFVGAPTVYEGMTVRYNHKVYDVIKAHSGFTLTLKNRKTGEIVKGVKTLDLTEFIDLEIYELEQRIERAEESFEEEEIDDGWL